VGVVPQRELSEAVMTPPDEVAGLDPHKVVLPCRECGVRLALDAGDVEDPQKDEERKEQLHDKQELAGLCRVGKC
jgi:hypothetical protein